MRAARSSKMIIVLGGGPAGRMAALRLAKAGRKVTIIEKRAIGGQCVFDGCMLVCGLNDVARTIENSEQLRRLDVLKGEGLKPNYPTLIQKLEETQKFFSFILEKETLDAGITIEYGKEAEVRDGKVFIDGMEREAEAVIIATGAQPNIPEIPGINLNGVYQPRTLRTMRELPKEMVIIGGSISGAEFAYIYAAFGVKVHLIIRSTLLKMLPEEFRNDAREDLKKVDIREHATIEKILGTENVKGVVVDGKTIPCDTVLVTTGMKPESPYVSGINKREDGAIIVNDRMETSVKGIYACGDVIGAPYYTPVSRLQGFAAADAILGYSRTVDLKQVPFSIVLGRDYAGCLPIEEGTVKTLPNIGGPGTFWPIADHSIGHMMLSYRKEDGKILGFATSAPAGGVVATYLGYLVRKGVTIHEFSPLLEVHPMPDGLYSLIRFSGN